MHSTLEDAWGRNKLLGKTKDCCGSRVWGDEFSEGNLGVARLRLCMLSSRLLWHISCVIQFCKALPRKQPPMSASFWEPEPCHKRVAETNSVKDMVRQWACFIQMGLPHFHTSGFSIFFTWVGFPRSAVSKGIQGSVMGHSVHVYSMYSWNTVIWCLLESHLLYVTSFDSHNNLIIDIINQYAVLVEHKQVDNWVVLPGEKGILVQTMWVPPIHKGWPSLTDMPRGQAEQMEGTPHLKFPF